MTRWAARGRDENEANAPLLHGRRHGATGATVLHRILENDVSLLVNAMECTNKEATIVDPHQHSPEQQLPNLADRWRAVRLWHDGHCRLIGLVQTLMLRNQRRFCCHFHTSWARVPATCAENVTSRFGKMYRITWNLRCSLSSDSNQQLQPHQLDCCYYEWIGSTLPLSAAKEKREASPN